MPFLVPAIIALSSDTLVLYLNHLREKNSVNDEDEEEHSESRVRGAPIYVFLVLNSFISNTSACFSGL